VRESNNNAQMKLDLQLLKNGKRTISGSRWTNGTMYTEIIQFYGILMMMLLFPLPGATYSLLDICISHVYMNEHDDHPSIQETSKCITFQFKSYRSDGEGCVAQDTNVVEHFEKDNRSLPNPWIGIVS
jgi:hypothetical protein